MTSGTLTIVSPSKRTLSTRRGLSRKVRRKSASEGCCLLQALDLVAFEREKRRLQTGKKRRAEDQKNDREKEKREPDCRHPLPAAVCTTALRGKRMRARLPVISAETKLSSP